MRNGARGMPVALRKKPTTPSTTMTHRSPSWPPSWKAPSSMTTSRPGPRTANGTLVSLARLGVARKQRNAPTTLAIAKDQMMTYIRSRCSVTIAGPGWMP